MSIKNKPPSRFRPLGNILLILGGLFLLANIFLPQLFGPSIPQVPYSLFIHQIDDGDVSRVYVGQNEIRYQLKGEGENQYGQIFQTTPIFDLELPKRLEAQGVEFAAAPPAKNGWIGSLLSWVIPPLIFVGIWQFFLNRSAGGGLLARFPLPRVKPKFMLREMRLK